MHKNRLLAIWSARQQERRLRRSVARAAALFTRLEPALAAILFDVPFLCKFEPSALLNLTASELATEWARQFWYSEPRRRDRDIKTMTLAAGGFLDLLGRVMREDGAVATFPRLRGHGATLAR